MREILTTQFIDMLLSDDRVKQIYTSTSPDGYVFIHLIGPSQKREIIYASGEFISDTIGVGHLLKLGLSELIELVFPGFLKRYAEEKEEAK